VVALVEEDNTEVLAVVLYEITDVVAVVVEDFK
jgi:hypothetical protein